MEANTSRRTSFQLPMYNTRTPSCQPDSFPATVMSPGSIGVEIEDNNIHSEHESDQSHSQRLEAVFKRELEYIPGERSHQNVAVLLLYWEVQGAADMDVTEEVNRLREVFEETYGFITYDGKLEYAEGKKAANLLNYHLAAFIKEYDSKDNLLIVYYAGHGVKSDKGDDLHLVGRNNLKSIDKNATRVVWRKAEQALHEADADKLVIFDCCYSGILANHARSALYSPKVFEYIGSTDRDHVAVGPGKDSFTTALTWALTQMSRLRRGFTTAELLDKIHEHEDFKKLERQIPVLAERNKKPSLFRLLISSHRTSAEEHSRTLAQTKTALPYEIQLQFVFTTRPKENQLKQFCQGLKRAIHGHDVPVQGILWGGTKDRDGLLRAYAGHWRQWVMRRKRLSNAQSLDENDLESTISHTSNGYAPTISSVNTDPMIGSSVADAVSRPEPIYTQHADNNFENVTVHKGAIVQNFTETTPWLPLVLSISLGVGLGLMLPYSRAWLKL